MDKIRRNQGLNKLFNLCEETDKKLKEYKEQFKVYFSRCEYNYTHGSKILTYIENDAELKKRAFSVTGKK